MLLMMSPSKNGHIGDWEETGGSDKLIEEWS